MNTVLEFSKQKIWTGMKSEIALLGTDIENYKHFKKHFHKRFSYIFNFFRRVLCSDTKDKCYI